MILVKQLMFLPAYGKPFTTRLPSVNEIKYKSDDYHWIIKFLVNATISYFIIAKIISGDYNLSFLILTIIAYSCYIISMISLYFIRKWNRMVNSFGSTEEPKEPIYLKKFNKITCCGY